MTGFVQECHEGPDRISGCDDLDWGKRVRRLKIAPRLLIAAALCLSAMPARSEHAVIRGAGASTCSDYARVYDAFRLSMDQAADGDVSRHATANFLQYEEWSDGYILGWRRASKAQAYSPIGITSTSGDGSPTIARNIDPTLSRMQRSSYSRKCAARLSELRITI